MSSQLAKDQLGEMCVVCGQSKFKGIHLYTSFICTECEKSIISTDTSDPQYKYYIKQLKKINTPEIYS
ncbi:sigma factor G inhibitor Gin [Bacillus dakarensis]|uniref:sigma factor G inhibitor Gin n=1 Tax=Robertmurraya dakarensis TaxID=1926278 RepID=UPI0009812063|nr:sigma factor G inhibitor Gin [Bacillus dakarensis]